MIKKINLYKFDTTGSVHQRFLVEWVKRLAQAYGLETHIVQGPPLEGLQKLTHGLVDFAPEMPVHNVHDLFWQKILQGEWIALGPSQPDMKQGVFVRRSTLDAFPEMTCAEDLASYGHHFMPYQHFNRPAYMCGTREMMATSVEHKRVQAMLGAQFDIVIPDTESSLKAHLDRAVTQQQHIALYHWNTSAWIEMYDLVHLPERREYDAVCWQRLKDSGGDLHDDDYCAWPSSPLLKVIRADCLLEYPQWVAQVLNIYVPETVRQDCLRWSIQYQGDEVKICHRFINEYPEVWQHPSMPDSVIAFLQSSAA